MKVFINGESCQVPDALTVSGLLAHLGIHSGRVAIERNLEILPRSQWDSVIVCEGDRFEIVHFVGGG